MNPYDVDPQRVCEDLDHAVRKACAETAPDDRFCDMNQLAHDLTELFARGAQDAPAWITELPTATTDTEADETPDMNDIEALFANAGGQDAQPMDQDSIDALFA